MGKRRWPGITARAFALPVWLGSYPPYRLRADGDVKLGLDCFCDDRRTIEISERLRDVGFDLI